MKKTVILDFELVGFHYWDNAPAPVSFLKSEHNFRFRLGFSVTDLDREIEIFMQEDLVKEYINEAYGTPCDFGSMSCEMIAKDLLEFGIEDDCIWVEVFEDNRGGARVDL